MSSRRVLPFLLLFAFAVTAHAGEAGETTILLVRHAEAATGMAAGIDPDDPPLTAAGAARAAELARVAEHAGVRAVYTSQLKRTQLTAAPLADAGKLPVTAIPVERAAIAEHVAATAKRIGEQHGSTALVVGHSNTIPLIVKALTGVDVAPIAHEEYDRLFIVILRPGAAPKLIQARYGAASKLLH